MALYRSFVIFCFVLIQFTFASSLSDEERFSSFIETYGKLYKKGSDEYDRRFENFKVGLKLSYTNLVLAKPSLSQVKWPLNSS